MGVNGVPPSDQSLAFLILGQRVRVKCPAPLLRQVLLANFGAMVVAEQDFPPDLEYSVSSSDTAPLFSLIPGGRAALDASDLGDLLYLLEKDITVELQKRRADLFFLHAAAIDWKGNACLLAADSGRGKSTTTWALLHHGFRYLSDELSPIDLDSMQVFPYPHALCLKQAPPVYPLPRDAIHLGRTMHVPARSLPGAAVSEPRRLGAVFLISYCPGLSAPTLCPIGSAEASARLYVNALNPLAHPERGLDAVVRIAQHAPCFAVCSAELPTTCALIRNALEHTLADDRSAQKA
jgi:hypothetical protein